MFNVKCEIVDVRGFSRETMSRTAHARLRNSVRLRPTPTTAAQRCPVGARSRLGFTLIELLIAIAIIATLSALFLGASRAAMEFARASRTKTTITKLHTLIMEQYASYETRRVDIHPDVVKDINNNPAFAGNPQAIGNAMQDMRLLATRELMKYEMPDRWSDAVAVSNARLDSTIQMPLVINSVPTISRTYYRRFMQAVKALKAKGEDEGLVDKHQAAECLYLTVMMMTGDGEARTLFSAQDIGDDDGDGAPEFLDGWGNPIAWSRWPAGYYARSFMMSGDSDADHDPFDPFRRHSVSATPVASLYPSAFQPFIQHLRNPAPASGVAPGFRVVPLIYSSGPDGFSDINTSGQTSVVSNDVVLDPYSINPSGPNAQSFPANAPAYFFGLPFDGENDGTDNTIDNITNHLQEGR